MHTSARTVLEQIATDTSIRLLDARALGIRFGEETITDLTLLELKKAHCPEIHVLQTSKYAEKSQGTDWEWWLGSDVIGWVRLAIQAKKLNANSGRYDQLGHKVGGVAQVDLLEAYAAATKSVPMYCFFNSVDVSKATSGWQCCKSFQCDQLSCTLTPSSVVRSALRKHGCRTFKHVHANPLSLPWRCIVLCLGKHVVELPGNAQAQTADRIESLFGTRPVVRNRLPSVLEEARDSGSVPESYGLVETRGRRIRPRQIAIIELKDSVGS